MFQNNHNLLKIQILKNRRIKILSFSLLLMFLNYFSLTPAFAEKYELCEGFTSETVPSDIETLLTKNSLIENEHNDFVKIEDLRYLKLKYRNLNGEEKNGEMLINSEIAQEVLEIFKELYGKEFPIAKMELIERDEYKLDDKGSNDEKSMSANNTSALRISENVSARKPWHALGMAIDINPMFNPCKYPNAKDSEEQFVPQNAKEYLENRCSIDENNKETGIIDKDSICYKIFEKYGWEWGGNWDDPVDLHHFQKYTWTTEFPRKYSKENSET